MSIYFAAEEHPPSLAVKFLIPAMSRQWLRWVEYPMNLPQKLCRSAFIRHAQCRRKLYSLGDARSLLYTYTYIHKDIFYITFA